ncbi:30S ribosomal protein S15 [Candidatus Woesearchaeota archaeon]|nr:30S ribosomal protein S15 [Candidatus Woesearchaeota archaeon]
MARMHSRARGQAGSTKPSKKELPSWVRYTPKEVEMIVVKLAKEKNSASQIGTILRDIYGIPDVSLIVNKKLTQILKEKNLVAETPEDLTALIRRSIEIRKHLESNRKDEPAKRGLLLTESKINRLVKYYKKNGALPADWKYDPNKVKLLI